MTIDSFSTPIYFLGFDPGGKSRFGWCIAKQEGKTLKIIDGGTANNAFETFKIIYEKLHHEIGDFHIGAIGIDSPLFMDESNDRKVDSFLRRLHSLSNHKSTIIPINSLRCSVVAQAIQLTGLLRNKLGNSIPVAESHPKAMLYHSNAIKEIISNVEEIKSDHIRDAALAALTAWAMVEKPPCWVDLIKLCYYSSKPFLLVHEPVSFPFPLYCNDSPPHHRHPGET